MGFTSGKIRYLYSDPLMYTICDNMNAHPWPSGNGRIFSLSHIEGIDSKTSQKRLRKVFPEAGGVSSFFVTVLFFGLDISHVLPVDVQ